MKNNYQKLIKAIEKQYDFTEELIYCCKQKERLTDENIKYIKRLEKQKDMIVEDFHNIISIEKKQRLNGELNLVEMKLKQELTNKYLKPKYISSSKKDSSPTQLSLIDRLSQFIIEQLRKGELLIKEDVQTLEKILTPKDKKPKDYHLFSDPSTNYHQKTDYHSTTHRDNVDNPLIIPDLYKGESQPEPSDSKKLIKKK